MANRRSETYQPVAIATAVTILILVFWQYAGAPNFDFLPKPTEILSTITDRWSSLQSAMLATGYAALVGFGIGCSVAVILALVALISPSAENAILRLGLALYAVPIIVVAPLFVLWLGSGPRPRIALSALAVFFGVLVNTIRGLRSASVEGRQLLHVFAASGLQVLRFVRLPSALPYIMNALKVAAPAAVFGAIVGEWVGADRGLGVVLIFSLFQFQVPLLWAAMLLTTAIALGGYAVVSIAERYLMPWHESVKAARLEQ